MESLEKKASNLDPVWANNVNLIIDLELLNKKGKKILYGWLKPTDEISNIEIKEEGLVLLVEGNVLELLKFKYAKTPYDKVPRIKQVSEKFLLRDFKKRLKKDQELPQLENLYSSKSVKEELSEIIEKL